MRLQPKINIHNAFYDEKTVFFNLTALHRGVPNIYRDITNSSSYSR